MSIFRCFSAVTTHHSTTDVRLNHMSLKKTDLTGVAIIVW